MFLVVLGLTVLLFVLCFFPRPRSWISRCVRALWVCRISAVSAGLGVMLFLAAAPARDLFLEIDAGYAYWFVFFALVLAWALVVHYAARKALEQQAWAAGDQPLPLDPKIAQPLQRQFAGIGTWIPRFLGVFCFVAIWVGLAGAEKTLVLMVGASDDIDRPHFSGLKAATFVTASLYVLIAVFRRLYRRPLSKLLRGDPEAVIAEPSPIWFLKFLASPVERTARAVRLGGIKADWIAVGIVAGVILCFVISAIAPLTFGYLVPRAWFVPVMLGLPVFPLSIITAVSHRLRFPALLLLALVLAWLSLLAPAYHDARTMAVDAKVTVARQTTLEHALERWTSLNCPADGSGGQNCAKHPIIVALAGGASRAAFLSATVTGDILDTTRADQNLRDFATQTFAISGVSGGAVGAVMFRTALQDADAAGQAPCKSTDRLWYGFEPTENSNRLLGRGSRLATWKACLQSIAAGDFLSPAILGLVFRDPWAGVIGRLKSFVRGNDRAALLERAFEERYAIALAGPESGFPLIASDPEAQNRRGLARRLGYLRQDIRWLPLLLLNGTSVDSGRRVIASELAPRYRLNGEEVLVFPEAYDLFELLATAPRTDIALSTAATLSARFPIVSPYGALPSSDPQLPAERVVDGGYFENDGITTALDLARAIRALRPQIEPIILHVTNDPVRRAGQNFSAGDARQEYPPTAPTPRVSAWFESLANPLMALYGTRGGHAAEAVAAVLAAHKIDYVRFQVFNEAPLGAAAGTGCHLDEHSQGSSGTMTPIDEVSMSWWLSGAVQEYLDRQLCHPTNQEAWMRFSKLLKRN